MIGPRMEDIPEIAAAKWEEYPSSFIAGTVMPPTADAVATPEPEIAPKSVDANTVTTAKLPLIHPIRELEMSISLFVILRDIIFPARMKNGIAKRELEFMPAKSFCGSTIKGIPATFNATSVPIPRAR